MPNVAHPRTEQEAGHSVAALSSLAALPDSSPTRSPHLTWAAWSWALMGRLPFCREWGEVGGREDMGVEEGEEGAGAVGGRLDVGKGQAEEGWGAGAAPSVLMSNLIVLAWARVYV